MPYRSTVIVSGWSEDCTKGVLELRFVSHNYALKLSFLYKIYDSHRDQDWIREHVLFDIGSILVLSSMYFGTVLQHQSIRPFPYVAIIHEYSFLA